MAKRKNIIDKEDELNDVIAILEKRVTDPASVFTEWSSKCPDCDTLAGRPHRVGCDVEHCSACGLQRLMCDCLNHDPIFARWTGFWPGALEATALKLDLNSFYTTGAYKIFMIKPLVFTSFK